MKKISSRKNIIRMLLMLAISMVTLFVYAIGVHADDDPKPRKISRIGKKTITLYVGQEKELGVRTTPSDADEDKLKWTIVSGKNVVRFDDDDRTDDEIEIVAKKKGTAKVRCTIKGTSKKITYTIKVKETPKKIYAKSSKSQTLKVGNTVTLRVSKDSGLANKKITWTIKNKKIVGFANSTKKGTAVKFKAKKAGTTKIICKNTSTGQKITFTIRVNKKSSGSSNYGDSGYDD